jgi:hypothetical protein
MKSAPHMRWHYRYRRIEGVIQHPSDAEAWKHCVETNKNNFLLA